MGSINVNYIKRDKNESDDSIYRDLYLDLTPDYKIKSNYGRETSTKVDIKVARDIEAVNNSLRNLFTTRPGQRLLYPEYGVDLDQFLFQPISSGTGRIIGEALNYGIEQWEPRVRVDRFDIEANADNNEYVISLSYSIPSLKASGRFNATYVYGEGMKV